MRLKHANRTHAHLTLPVFLECEYDWKLQNYPNQDVEIAKLKTWHDERNENIWTIVYLCQQQCRPPCSTPSQPFQFPTLYHLLQFLLDSNNQEKYNPPVASCVLNQPWKSHSTKPALKQSRVLQRPAAERRNGCLANWVVKISEKQITVAKLFLTFQMATDRKKLPNCNDIPQNHHNARSTSGTTIWKRHFGFVLHRFF